MAKHTYTITLNRTPSSRDPLQYTYSKTPCTLTCSPGCAAVSFEMGTLKTHEDLISLRVKVVEDALRKMHLIHALRTDSRLRVRSVTITIDGKEETYTQGHPGFPFLYSMLTAKHLNLPETWQEPRFLNALLASTKTDTEKDHRYACLYSYLAGAGMSYESEKFTYYWTAVNALYNHIFDCANPIHARYHGKRHYADTAFNKAVLKQDSVGLSILLRLFGSGNQVSDGQARRQTHRKQYGAMKTLLHAISRDNYPELYRQLKAHRTDLHWLPEGPLGDHLRECCARTGSSAWGFLMFDYAYYIRCNYLHGEKTTILFTTEADPKLAAFRALNTFLEEFLKEMIPRIFGEDWFTEKTYLSICPPRK